VTKQPIPIPEATSYSKLLQNGALTPSTLTKPADQVRLRRIFTTPNFSLADPNPPHQHTQSNHRSLTAFQNLKPLKTSSSKTNLATTSKTKNPHSQANPHSRANPQKLDLPFKN
jgi:hypothetical protein